MSRAGRCVWILVLVLPAARPAWSQSGPVTVVTDTMIEASGARTLKDVLVTYVPGMTFSQDHNEVNVAMRGAYASSQQKFLVLVDGHVLNSRSYATANPDFGITLDNVKRIEIQRGPASSLYGPGALTAVVSIVTRTADDVDGVRASVGVGSSGQTRLSGLYGARTERGDDLLAWGTLYRSDGQTISIPAERNYSRVPGAATAIVDGFRGPPSHDAGLRLQTGAFTLFTAHRRGRYVEPFSAGGPTGEAYVYDDYQAGLGVGPGLAMSAFNIGVGHERTARGTSLLVRGYADRMEVVAHVVSDPGAGAHSLVMWKDWDAGVVVRAGRPYAVRAGDGRWTAGAQVDYMRVDDSVLSTGTGGRWDATLPSGALLDLGREYTGSGFIEVLHPLGPAWIAGAGVRYDHKTRHEGDDVEVVSPHASLAWRPDARSSVAVSYAKGFVDAPYWYRYNSLPSYQGSRNLRPEYLTSIQVTPSATIAPGVTLRATLFVNDLDNLVWRNNNARPGEPTYQNAGVLKSWGVEPELRYVRGEIAIDANLTHQRAREALNYDVSGGEVHDVPAWSGNAVLSIRPAAAARHDVLVSGTVRYVGRQRSPIDIRMGDVVFFEPDRVVDRAVLVDAGLRASSIAGSGWMIDARLFNLFDAGYEQGGSVPHPYPQAGRSALVQVGRRF